MNDILRRPTSTRGRVLAAWALAAMLGVLALPRAGQAEAEPAPAVPQPKAAPVASAAPTLASPLPEGFGELTSPYGERTDPITGAAAQFHRGVDLKAPFGVEILAPAAGRVLAATQGDGDDDAWGKVIKIGHEGGVETYFAHLGAVLVQEGDTVSAGQRIGLVGSTGASTGPHLHFEVLENGVTVDPAKRIPGIGDC